MVPDRVRHPDIENADPKQSEQSGAHQAAQQPIYAAGTGLDSGVYVDLKPICGQNGQLVRISIDGMTSASDFLDEVYFAINRFGKIMAYTYTTRWLLRDEKTGRVFDQMGKKYCESREKHRDDRLLSEVGIPPDARLVAYPVANA